MPINTKIEVIFRKDLEKDEKLKVQDLQKELDEVQVFFYLKDLISIKYFLN